MKKKLITILTIINLYADEGKTLNIDDMDIFGKMLSEQLIKFKNIEIKNEIKAEITINTKGNFDYKILNESNIIGFNETIKNFLEEQKKINFPTFRNKEFKTIITFKADLKEKKKTE